MISTKVWVNEQFSYLVKMSPTHNLAMNLQSRASSSQSSESADELRRQWTQPKDVFSILLLLRGEIVNKALAQLAGGNLTPVTFSFGVTLKSLLIAPYSVLRY